MIMSFLLLNVLQTLLLLIATRQIFILLESLQVLIILTYILIKIRCTKTVANILQKDKFTNTKKSQECLKKPSRTTKITEEMYYRCTKFWPISHQKSTTYTVKLARAKFT